MKVGDLVQLSPSHGASFRAGLVVKLIEKKCWRTHILGHKIEWGKIDPEPHAIVLIEGDKRTIPLTDLEVVNESR